MVVGQTHFCCEGVVLAPCLHGWNEKMVVSCDGMLGPIKPGMTIVGWHCDAITHKPVSTGVLGGIQL